MSNKPQKAGRPKKVNLPKTDSRTPKNYSPFSPAEVESLKSIFNLPQRTPDDEKASAQTERQDRLNQLRVNPKGNASLPPLFSNLVMKNASKMEKSLLGNGLIEMIEAFETPVLEKLFKGILEMKRNSEDSPRRNYYAYSAYCNFLKENGKEPTKPELKKFIQRNPDLYLVGILEKGGWTIVWKETGLSTLKDR